MITPGQYNAVCTQARESTGAQLVALIVVNGNQGNGFSVQGTPETVARLPDILRGILDSLPQHVARDLKDFNRLREGGPG